MQLSLAPWLETRLHDETDAVSDAVARFVRAAGCGRRRDHFGAQPLGPLEQRGPGIRAVREPHPVRGDRRVHGVDRRAPGRDVLRPFFLRLRPASPLPDERQRPAATRRGPRRRHRRVHAARSPLADLRPGWRSSIRGACGRPFRTLPNSSGTVIRKARRTSPDSMRSRSGCPGIRRSRKRPT